GHRLPRRAGGAGAVNANRAAARRPRAAGLAMTMGRRNSVAGRFDRELEERLVRYARIDTQSDESSPTSPSTEIQLDLLNLLVEELEEIGARDVRLTDYGAVLATIPATVEDGAPVVGFLAHVDTAPGFNASGVKPIVHRN